VDTERRGVCHALYLAALLLSLKRGRRGRTRTSPAYYGCAHTCVAGRRIHHRLGPRRLHKRGGAAVRGGDPRPGRPARVGTCQDGDAGAHLAIAGGDGLALTRALRRRPPRRRARDRRGAPAVRGGGRATTTRLRGPAQTVEGLAATARQLPSPPELPRHGGHLIESPRKYGRIGVFRRRNAEYPGQSHQRIDARSRHVWRSNHAISLPRSPECCTFPGVERRAPIRHHSRTRSCRTRSAVSR